MTAETDIAAVADSGDNTPADVRTALTSVLARADLNDVHVAAQMYLSSDQTLASSGDDKIDFDAEAFDTDGSIVNLASSRFDIQTTGYYLVIGHWQWGATAPSSLILTVYVDGAEGMPLVRGHGSTGYGGYGSQQVMGVLSLAASSYVELFTNTGGASSVVARGHATSVHLRSTLTIARLF